MHGAVFGVILVVGLGLVLLSGASPIFIIPIVLIGGAGLLAAPLLGVLRGSKAGAEPGPSGVPTTRDASYDPRTGPGSTA